MTFPTFALYWLLCYALLVAGRRVRRAATWWWACRQWRCKRCGVPFPGSGAFSPYQYRCEPCQDALRALERTGPEAP